MQLKETSPIARKEHRCSLCGRTIKPGETYSRSTHIAWWDGQLYDWKQCTHCRWLVRVHDESIEYADDEGYGPDTIEEWEPSTIAGLRAKAMWRRKWTRRDGTLYAVGDGS